MVQAAGEENQMGQLQRNPLEEKRESFGMLSETSSAAEERLVIRTGGGVSCAAVLTPCLRERETLSYLFIKKVHYHIMYSQPLALWRHTLNYEFGLRSEDRMERRVQLIRNYLNFFLKKLIGNLTNFICKIHFGGSDPDYT